MDEGIGTDYTSMNKGTWIDETCRVEVCPKCGKRGKASHTKHRSIYIHTTNANGSRRIVRDGCQINKFVTEEK